MSLDYDSDELPPEDEPGSQFSWRLPKETSHSDWTIEITPTPLLQTAASSDVSVSVYHVHKGILAASGNRSCDYFARLFQHDGFAESKNNTSRISLPDLAADAFPVMLDFIYSPSRELDIHTNNAASLHYLAQYFENTLLRYEARQFIKDDLRLSNCHLYYERASLFCDSKILNAVAALCAKVLVRISPASPIMDGMDPEFWPTVLEKVNFQDQEMSRHANLLTVALCQSKRPHLPADCFHKLTDSLHLPRVHPSCATKLLQLHDSYRKSDKSKGKCKKSLQALSRLETRCIQSLAENWRGLKHDEVETLQEQPPLVLAELLRQSVASASKQLSHVEEAIDRHMEVEAMKIGRLSRQLTSFQVEIEGAGCEQVNGVYQLDGYFHGACHYVMEGQWKDEDAKFHLFKYRFANNDCHWFISIVMCDCPPEKKANIDFYSVSTSSDSLMPPSTGWIRDEKGKDPSPTLRYVVADGVGQIEAELVSGMAGLEVEQVFFEA